MNQVYQQYSIESIDGYDFETFKGKINNLCGDMNRIVGEIKKRKDQKEKEEREKREKEEKEKKEKSCQDKKQPKSDKQEGQQ